VSTSRKLSRIEVFPTLDSTSLEAKRRVALGEGGPLWIVALKQTAGYGRRGTEWLQEEGDIAATFLFRPEAPKERLPELSFVAALSVADAVRRFAPRADLSFKWPNDILAGGAKIAGLLLELVGEAPLVALGCGVNIVTAPRALPIPPRGCSIIWKALRRRRVNSWKRSTTCSPSAGGNGPGRALLPFERSGLKPPQASAGRSGLKRPRESSRASSRTSIFQARSY
jgi:hypothetical protein